MFLRVDLGTSAIKLLVINDSNSVLAESKISLDVSRPHPLWSDQEPDELEALPLSGVINYILKRHKYTDLRAPNFSNVASWLQKGRLSIRIKSNSSLCHKPTQSSPMSILKNQHKKYLTIYNLLFTVLSKLELFCKFFVKIRY